MDLIIKPTQRCNFHCSYCSSTDIAKSNNRTDDLNIDKIFKFLKRFPETNTIIVNGGDPLLVSPNYYFQILEYIELNDLPAKLEICSNLWDFYNKPEKWEKLFKHPKVKVGTSFEYGNQRVISEGKALTESLFLDIIYKFKSYFNYLPDFISVITPENKNLAIKNVELAKELNVQSKLNYVVKSGRQGEGISIGDIHLIYLEIIKNELVDFEDNTRKVLQKIKGYGNLICPHTKRCDEGIRSLQPLSGDDFEYNSCGAFADDKKYPINFEQEMNGALVLPLRNLPELQYMKDECTSCINFNLCNSCYKTVTDHKESGLVEQSCTAMKKFRYEFEKL